MACVGPYGKGVIMMKSRILAPVAVIVGLALAACENAGKNETGGTLIGAAVGGLVASYPKIFPMPSIRRIRQRSHFSSPCRQGVMRPVSLQSSRKILKAYSLDFHRHNSRRVREPDWLRLSLGFAKLRSMLRRSYRRHPREGYLLRQDPIAL